MERQTPMTNKAIAGETVKLIELLCQLQQALLLTKSDAEHHGFKYGNQSNCIKALRAFDVWRAS